jgi:pilus assembly protein CpaE
MITMLMRHDRRTFLKYLAGVACTPVVVPLLAACRSSSPPASPTYPAAAPNQVPATGSSATGATSEGARARNADALRVVGAAHDPAAPSGSIIAVFGVSGGVGKTTLATNLAVALAQESSASVALVDLDVPFGDVALMLDIHPEQDILDALNEDALDDLERLQDLMVRTPQGVHVLAAPLAPDDAEALDSSKVGKLLTRLAALHQFVIVDSPVGITEITAAALDVAELDLLVTTPEVPALRRTHACLRMLQGLDFPTQKVQLVLNRVSSKTKISEAEAVAALGYPVTWLIKNDYAAMQSSAMGQPVVISQPKTELARAVRAMARQIRDIASAPPGRSGWRS